MWHHRWLCLALAEFMVIWRWENVLLNKFLNWSLKMLLVTWCAIEHLCCFVGNIHLCSALSAVHPLYSSIFFGTSSPKAGGSVGLVAGTISALYRATLQLLHHMTICFGTIHPNTLPFHAFFHKGLHTSLTLHFFLHRCVLQFSQCL